MQLLEKIKAGLDSGGDVQSVLPFDGYRLKCDRLIEASDQHVRARTHTERTPAPSASRRTSTKPSTPA